MLLNLIVFKFVPRILKCLDAWRMSFFIFLFFTVNLFSYIYIYIYIYMKKKDIFRKKENKCCLYALLYMYLHFLYFISQFCIILKIKIFRHFPTLWLLWSVFLTTFILQIFCFAHFLSDNNFKSKLLFHMIRI